MPIALHQVFDKRNFLKSVVGMCAGVVIKRNWLGRAGLVLSLVFLISFSNSLLAQKVYLSTNLLDCANFGTINGEIGLALSNHFSVYAQGKYNPFEFDFKGKRGQINNRLMSVGLGSRFWLWHTYSGWFFMSHASWWKYNIGGLLWRHSYEGDAYGITLGAGYTLMLGPKWNMEFGAGLMGGYTDYTKYDCTVCGKITGRRRGFFAAPNNLMVQVTYLLW